VIEPALADDAFLEDVARAPAGAVHLWWLGQSGFLIKAPLVGADRKRAPGSARCPLPLGAEGPKGRGRFLLIDPYLSDSLTRKYADSGKPHVRMTRRVVDPARLRFVDVVTASHGHTDHLDAETLRAALASRARLVCPEEIAPVARERAGVEPVTLRDGESARLAAFTIERVPAAHEELSPEFSGFVVTCGPHRIYHAGDTVWHDAIVERVRPHEVTVALVPINGRAPERGVAGNLDGPEAARLAHAVGAHLAVPMHYELFEFNTASPDAFVGEAARIGQTVRVLRAGERLTLAP
jgi:L-ascorbate metabolism protein UlaG (beta-lactamase superfamily)